MTHIYHQIGRPYWAGFEAPSTAHIAPEIAKLKIGGGELILNEYNEDTIYPDVLDILVDIIPIRTQSNPLVNHQGKTLSVYGTRLQNYNLQAIELRSKKIVRLAGISQATPFLPITVSHSFDVCPDQVQLRTTIPLGGFISDQGDVSKIAQYSVSFFEADDEIQFHLDQGTGLLQIIRDGQLIVRLFQQDSTGQDYQTVDLVQHGTTTAWLTLHKR